jgi:hypothetical protein
MGGGSSVNIQSTEYSEYSVLFRDEEIQDLIVSFFDFYPAGVVESKSKSNKCWNFDRFETIPNDVIVQQSLEITTEQKLRTEYFRSISTIHPLRVHEHLFEYVSSGMLDIRDSDEYTKLMSIVNRNRDHIQSLIATAESINLVEGEATFDIDYNDGELEMKVTASRIRLPDGDERVRLTDLIAGTPVVANKQGENNWRFGKILEVQSDGTYNIWYDCAELQSAVQADLVRLDVRSYLSVGAEVEGNYKDKGIWRAGKIRKVWSRGCCSSICFTSAQEELLEAASKRLESVCTFAEYAELLRNNSLPTYVQKHFRNESRNPFHRPSRILLAYYVIFRGRILPLVVNLKNEILEWARKYDSEYSTTVSAAASPSPSVPLPTPDAVMGVSLRFLKEFVAKNKIHSDMTTAKVVSDIIVPTTCSTKETYINAHLLHEPHYISDLRKIYHKDKSVLVDVEAGYGKIDGLYCFLSHAWSMPFLELIGIAEHAADVHFKSQVESNTFKIINGGEILDSSFFWIDVFCKNQHIPAPAMEEFHKALKGPEVAVIALFPRQPIALQRIWCLFEIWTAVVNNITILPTMSEDSFKYFSKTSRTNFNSINDLRAPACARDYDKLEKRKKATEKFKVAFMKEMKKKIVVRVQDSKATVPADIDMIMGLIRKSTSVDRLNEDIFKAICETLWTRIETEYGYSKVLNNFCELDLILF